MGEIENKIKRKIKIGNLQNSILGIVGMAGILAVGAVAPGIFSAIGLAQKTGLIRSRMLFSAKRSVQKLVESGFLVFENSNKGAFLRITPQGKNHLLLNLVKGQEPKRKRKWDKKWRIIIFDIREKQKKLRDKVRNTLVEIGFERLQDSVWVYPYDCEDLINLLKADFMIGKDVLYIVADHIEHDKYLREHFKLPPIIRGREL